MSAITSGTLSGWHPKVGLTVGDTVGRAEGKVVGILVGDIVGDVDGDSVGEIVGEHVTPQHERGQLRMTESPYNGWQH